MTLLGAIRKLICFNQKQTIQYEYVISEKHKELKEALNNFNNAQLSFDDLKAKYEELIIHSYETMLKVFKANVPYIHEIYKSCGYPDMPRISVKTIEGSYVIDVFRDSFNASFHVNDLTKNTGFATIVNENKKYYLNNNIPKSYSEKSYNNSRLDQSKVDDFTKSLIEWKDCWEYVDDNQYYYSSTLILPMAIVADNENDSSVFLEHFFDHVKQSNGARSIWGFLCFDHVHENFFYKEEEIVDASYIVADILSLYLMFFYNHLSGSTTYNTVEDIVLNKLSLK